MANVRGLHRDVLALRFFYLDKGDVERSSDCEKVFQAFPELKKLWEDKKQAERNFERALRDIVSNHDFGDDDGQE